MPRTKTGKGAGGAGSIRKITTTRNGKTYTYWQGRYTEGFDLGTGKQIQRSITGKTQKEVAQKLKQVTLDIDNGVYHAPCKLTLAQWLEIWSKTYLGGVKPRTAHIYKSDIRLHILPALGAVRLEALNAPMIQAFYNAMGVPSEQNPKGLSAKTVKNVHGVLHKALQQAVLIGYLRYNPADACILPRIERKKIKPFDDAQITAFLTAIQGNRFETLFILTLFTGMREGEVLGLTWDCIDFHTGIVSVEKQMQLHQDKGSKGYELVSPKNGRSRTIAAAQTVLARLQQQRRWQMQQKLLLGSDWQNPEGLVFTNEFGTHLTKPTVYREYKRIVAAIGCPNARFHDLRHSYAVAAIRAGDDIKTVQGNLGHATAAFTLDVYGHVTDQMKRESADRMERFIRTVSVGWPNKAKNKAKTCFRAQKTPETQVFREFWLEVTPGFEPGNEGFADPCLTTWLCHRVNENHYTIYRRSLSRVKCPLKRDFFHCFLCYFTVVFAAASEKNVKRNRTNVAMRERV